VWVLDGRGKSVFYAWFVVWNVRGKSTFRLYGNFFTTINIVYIYSVVFDVVWKLYYSQLPRFVTTWKIAFLQQYANCTANITVQVSIYGTTTIVLVRYTFYSENVYILLRLFSHFLFFFLLINCLCRTPSTRDTYRRVGSAKPLKTRMIDGNNYFVLKSCWTACRGWSPTLL